MGQILDFGEIRRGLLGVNIQTIDPAAAETLGAGRVARFWHVTLPLIAPGVAGGALYGVNGQGSGRMPGFGTMLTDEQITAQVDTLLAENPADKVLTFACNWCSYAGADTAGVGRLV